MRNRLLEIVAFLIDFIQDSQDQSIISEDISKALNELGYSDLEVSTAFNWFIDRFQNSPTRYFNSIPAHNKSIRVLTDQERQQIEPEGYGFLLKMMLAEIIDNHQLELILEQNQMFSGEPVSLEEIKLIVSSIVFKDFDTTGETTIFDSADNNSKLFN